MQQLWSPWRSQYIHSFKSEDADTHKCFLCHAATTDNTEAALVVARRPLTMVVMNLYPYNSGHVLVTPRRHIGMLSLLTVEEHHELFSLLTVTTTVLEKVLSPHGINIGANLGSAAGAGVPDHLHFHAVPRWNGDTNFMATLGDTKVISEALETTYFALKEEFSKLPV
jgi:ATP adenylyltransferase